MAFDPRDLPQVGDEYGNGIVARTVVTAEGLEITVRENLEDAPGGEDRPVSIPQRVHPDALDNVTGDEDAAKADTEEREEIERDQRAKAADAQKAEQPKPAAVTTKNAPVKERK